MNYYHSVSLHANDVLVVAQSCSTMKIIMSKREKAREGTRGHNKGTERTIKLGKFAKDLRDSIGRFRQQ